MVAQELSLPDYHTMAESGYPMPEFDAFNIGYSIFRPLLNNTDLSKYAKKRVITCAPRWPSQWGGTYSGYTALQVATACGNVEMIDHILKNSDSGLEMDPDIQCGKCFSGELRYLSRAERHKPLLHLALCYGQYEAAKTILSHVCSTESGYLPLVPPPQWLGRTTDVVGRARHDYKWELRQSQGPADEVTLFEEWIIVLPDHELPDDYSSDSTLSFE